MENPGYISGMEAPPTYSEVVDIQEKGRSTERGVEHPGYNLGIQQPVQYRVQYVSQEQNIYGEKPVHVVCTNCNTQVVTVVMRNSWSCSSWQYSHNCPNCRTLLGVFRPRSRISSLIIAVIVGKLLIMVAVMAFIFFRMN